MLNLDYGLRLVALALRKLRYGIGSNRFQGHGNDFVKNLFIRFEIL